jgi:DNA-binding response OmpR family regulator
MVMFKILLIEDEVMVLDVLRAYLEKEGYSVLAATTGREGMRLFHEHEVQLVILDLMLPDRSGESICQEIRQTSDVHLFMLTAKGSLEHRIDGLNMGADEYLVKPFSPRELVARVNALFRRLKPTSSELQIDERLSLDLAGHVVKVNGEVISLTTTEFKLLAYLIEHRGQVLSREQLIEQALCADFDGYDRTVDVHIKNIRKKIEVDTKQPRYIVTVMKVGYKFGG